MNWRRFVLRLVGVVVGGCLALVLLIALADPWGTLPFRSPLPRMPADHSQRWAYPELARERRFDSVIMGDSASRLFKPGILDPAVDARFVNLAMVRGFAYEQSKLLDVFLRAHPNPRAVMIGLDRQWCERGDRLEHFGYGPLPEFLYREDALAGFGNLLNMHAIETALRSASAELGLSRRPYGADGYTLLDVDFHRYDPALAKRLADTMMAESWPAPASPDPATWRYLPLDWLRERLDKLPASTLKLLVFVPHYHLYPAPGSVGAAMIDECKRRVVALAQGRPGASVYDMSLPGPLTSNQDLWWDAVHLRHEAMLDASRALADAFKGVAGPNVRILEPASAAASLSAR